MARQLHISRLVSPSIIHHTLDAISKIIKININIVDSDGVVIKASKDFYSKFCQNKLFNNEERLKRCTAFFSETLHGLSKKGGKGKIVKCPCDDVYSIIIPIMVRDNLLGGLVSEGFQIVLEPIDKKGCSQGDGERMIAKDRVDSIFAHLCNITKLLSEICNHKYLLYQKDTEISALNKIGKTLISTPELRKIMMVIVQGAAKTLGTTKCSLRLLDPEKKKLIFTVSCGLSKKYLHKRHEIKIGRSIVGRVVELRKPIVVEDVTQCKMLEYPEHAVEEGIRSLLSVPLMMENVVFGTLTVYSSTLHKYTKEEIQLLDSFATQAAIAIENKRLLIIVKHNLINITRSLAEAIDAKDKYTRGHSERTTWYAVATAREMNMSESRIEALEIATLLHDIGKIGVPEKILLKPGGLTYEEFEKIRKHPYISFKILAPGEFPAEVLTGVVQHHERIDGEGYPNGLSGEEISLEARIIEVADAFEAMVSDRPYRKALTIEDAIMELKRCSGKQFDPEVVDAFLRVLEKRKKKFGSYNI